LREAIGREGPEIRVSAVILEPVPLVWAGSSCPPNGWLPAPVRAAILAIELGRAHDRGARSSPASPHGPLVRLRARRSGARSHVGGPRASPRGQIPLSASMRSHRSWPIRLRLRDSTQENVHPIYLCPRIRWRARRLLATIRIKEQDQAGGRTPEVMGAAPARRPSGSARAARPSVGESEEAAALLVCVEPGGAGRHPGRPWTRRTVAHRDRKAWGPSGAQSSTRAVKVLRLAPQTPLHHVAPRWTSWWGWRWTA
jgi:hypothetical protein